MDLYEQIGEKLDKRPFRPFRIILKSGEVLVVERVAQAAVNRSRLFFGVMRPDQYTRRVLFTDIDRVEFYELKRTA